MMRWPFPSPAFQTVRPAARIIAMVVLCASCERGSGGTPGSTEVLDSAGVAIAFTRVGDDGPTCVVGPGTVRIGSADEASGSTLFGVNDIALLGDGRFAVVNRGTSQIKVFSPTGEPIHEFGRQGQGPGEFRNLWSVDARGDTLVVGDYRPWRFTFFTAAGDVIRAVPLSPPVIERPDFATPLAAGVGFIMEEPAFEVQDEFVDRVIPLHVYGEDGQRQGAVGDFWLDRFGYMSKELRYVGNPIFGANASFAHLRDDLIVYGTGRHEQLEVWSVDGQLRRIVRWQSRDRVVTPDDVDEWRRQRLALFEERFDITPDLQPIIDAQVGDHLPVAERFPGHEQVVVARDGSVWVKEYRRPFDEGPARWLVFDGDGGFVCSASVPAELYVLAVARDRVVGVMLDSLDVEYVLGYDVQPPMSGSRDLAQFSEQR